MVASYDQRIARELATRCPAALRQLLDSYTHAQKLGGDLWNFAVEVGQLREAGLANEDLHWLVRRGYAQQAIEQTASNGRRALHRERLLRPATTPGVVLTEKGAAWARQLGKERNGRQPVRLKTPTYDRSARELRVGILVVKRFRQPAGSQEWILLAFQEQRWRSSIDDPLPPNPGRCPKQHLHDTIQNLNRHQQQALIHFYGDGTGRRVCWAWR